MSIPIYTIKSGDLTIPIELKYHGSGIKIQDESGSVGLGWSLIAGGRISRTMKGAPDEHGFGSSEENNLMKLSSSHMTSDQKSSLYSHISLIGNKERDTENDMFSFSSPTVNGSFILNQPTNGQFECIPIPFKPIKLGYTLGAKYFDTFKLTDELGTTYSYGYDNSNGFGARGITYLSGGGFPESFLMAQAISSNKKDRVSFSYQKMHPPGSFSSRAIVDDKFVTTNNRPPGFNLAIPDVDPNVTRSLRLINYESRMLSQIEFTGGKVVFIADSNKRKIKTIQIYSSVNNVDRLIKEVSFTYNEFSHADHYTLKDITFKDKNSGEVYQYKFKYNDTIGGSKQPFPNAALTRSVDYWGYYNAAPNNYSFSDVPKHLINTEFHQGYP